MNLKQVKKRLKDISDSSTKLRTRKHPNGIITELCIIIELLIDEIDCIKNQPFTVLHQTFPESNPDVMSPPPFAPPNPLTPELPQRSRPINSPNPFRKGNAGDAE